MLLSVVQQISVKGKLFKSIQHRQSLGTPDFILSVIRNCYKILFISKPKPRRFTNNATALKEADFVREAILELLRGNLVEEIISPPDIVSPLAVSVHANVPVKSKLQHPPRATPGHLNFWKNFCSNSPLTRPKSCSNTPPLRKLPDYCFNFSVASILLLNVNMVY